MIADQVSVNEEIKVTLYLTETETIALDAKVAWIRTRGNEIHAGVVFIDIPQEAQDTLIDYAFTVQPDQVVKNWFKGWEEKLDPTQ